MSYLFWSRWRRLWRIIVQILVPFWISWKEFDLDDFIILFSGLINLPDNIYWRCYFLYFKLTLCFWILMSSLTKILITVVEKVAALRIMAVYPLWKCRKTRQSFNNSKSILSENKNDILLTFFKRKRKKKGKTKYTFGWNAVFQKARSSETNISYGMTSLRLIQVVACSISILTNNKHLMCIC